MRSVRAKATSMSCSITSRVMAGSSFVRSAVIAWDSAGESPAVGSSSSRSLGEPASASAISSWRCSPCERFRTASPSLAARPTASSTPRGGSRGPTVRLTPSTARSPPNSFESPLRLSATARSVMRLGWSDGLGSASAVLARREVTVVHGLLQEILGPVLPELRDGRVGLNHGVPELAALLLHLADVDVLDRVAIRVELHRAPRRVGDLDLPQRLQKLVAAFHVAADGPGGLVDPPRARVTGLREVRRDLPVLLAVLRHELLVDRRVQRGAVDE